MLYSVKQWKHKNTKLVTTERKKNYLVSELIYHIKKFFTKNLLAIEIKKIKIIMNKPVYLGLSILDISKSKMYEFWYDYLIPKYNEKVKLCYLDTDSFIFHMKTEDIYKIFQKNRKRFGTSNYEVDRPLPIEKNKNAVCLMKYELGGEIIEKSVGLQPKTCSYLKENNDKGKRSKRYKKVCCKKKP